MIDSYEFGRIVIDGQTFTSDVIIFPDRVDANWWRKEGHRLQLADLEGIWEAQPELLVVGTGATGRMEVAPEVARRLSDQGVGLVVERTGQACRRYNELAPTARVVAALHLTC